MKRVPITNMPRVSGSTPRIPPSYRVNDGISISDSLQNLVTGLGTSKDKSVGTTFVYNELGKPQLEMAFRSDWIARKIVSIPAQDATREWRAWQGSKEDNAKLETAEQNLGLQMKVKQAMIKARLYGGAALLMGVGDKNVMSKELVPEKVGKDQLKFLHVVSKWELSAGEIDWDVASDNYGQPKYYTRAGGDSANQIHPSRVIRFLGNEVPDIQLTNGWGDSILQSVNDAIVAAGMTSAAGAQLLHEIKMDVVSIPNLTGALANKKYAALLTERFGLANVTKSLFNILLLDKDEKWERITANMQGIPDTLKIYLLIASAAGDIPATRMLGQSPAGLSATGESDMRNWYDHVRSEQTTTQQPALRPLDQILIRSTLGTAQPDSIEYLWKPLWQMDEVQKATIIGQKANAFKIDFDTGLLPSDVLRDARINQLKEDDVYPGLDQILEDYGELDPIDDDPEEGSVIGPDGKPIPPSDPTHPINQAPPEPELGPDGQPLTPRLTAAKANPFGDMARRVRRANMRNRKYQHMDGVTRTLYVYRSVINTGALLAWAKTAGIPNLVASNELHTTIMYTQTPVDWSKAGEAYGQDEKGHMSVKPGGMRALQGFGNAIVLCFNSSELGYRHCDLKERTGATWKYAEYQPHVTLAYLNPEDPPWSEGEFAALGAYSGAIEFGPEVFAEASNPYVRDSNGNPYWGYDGGPGSGPQGGGAQEGRVAAVKEAVKNLMTKEGVKAAAAAAIGKLKDRDTKIALVNGAVQASLYHVAGLDYGPDMEKAIAHQIEHFAENAQVGLGRAKEIMANVGNKILGGVMGGAAGFRDAAPDPALVKALQNMVRAIEAFDPGEEA